MNTAGRQNPAFIFVFPRLGLSGVHILYKPHNVLRLFYWFKQRGALMGEKCDWPCWEIMNCDESKKCPAKARPGTPCWEIAREMSDYRYILQICTDCIVHVLKGEKTVLNKIIWFYPMQPHLEESFRCYDSVHPKPKSGKGEEASQVHVWRSIAECCGNNFQPVSVG